MCKLFPNVLACATFGNAPTSDGINRTTRSALYTPEYVMAGTGACPVDPTVTVGGQAISLGFFSKTCGYLVDYVRPMAIVLASFFALMIGIGGFKGGD
ncbi:hypothetical protein [Aeromicrobium sp.]|uniref:hypothetical protein n=1 Tax=Aeromicrobium sp. TaxID=1871063 RepID=UPI0039E5BD9C